MIDDVDKPIVRERKLREFTSNERTFREFVGTAILWPRDHKYYERSGFVTAALKETETDYIIAIYNPDRKLPAGWHTYWLRTDDLADFFSGRPEVVGRTWAESFILTQE